MINVDWSIDCVRYVTDHWLTDAQFRDWLPFIVIDIACRTVMQFDVAHTTDAQPVIDLYDA